MICIYIEANPMIGLPFLENWRKPFFKGVGIEVQTIHVMSFWKNSLITLRFPSHLCICGQLFSQLAQIFQNNWKNE